MSSSNDFREWLNSKDPKVVRSLVLDAYSSDRKFLRAFEKVVDSDLSSATGKCWAQLFSSLTDWDYQKNATYLLESNYWDSASKLTLISILNIIAYFLNINWKSDLDPSNNPDLKPDVQKSTTSSTQKAYQRQREELERRQKKNHADQASQKVDDHIHQPGSPHKQQSRPPAVSNNHKTTNVGSGEGLHPLVPIGLLALGGVLVGVIQSERDQNLSTPYNPYSEVIISESTPLEPELNSTSEPKPDPISDLELTQARRIQNNAVLICEHERAITTLKSIKTRTSNWNTKSVADSLIKDSKKKINFLNQDGKFGAYSEYNDCRYGFQWFDTDNQDSLRAFMAISAKCSNPSMSFLVREDDDERLPVIGVVNVKLSHLQGSYGEIAVPTRRFDGTYFPGDFTCK